jgi:hypothetical protein
MKQKLAIARGLLSAIVFYDEPREARLAPAARARVDPQMRANLRSRPT